MSDFLNPNFKFNLSLVAENYYFNKDYKKSKKIINHFSEDDIFYYWYRIKKEAQIIANQKGKNESLKFISSKF